MNEALARRTVTRHTGTQRLHTLEEFDDCKSDGETRLGTVTWGVCALFLHSSSTRMYVGCETGGDGLAL